MALRFVFSVPVGPGPQPRLRETLASLATQDADVQVAICHCGSEQDISDALAPFRYMIGHERHGPDEGQSSAINEGWRALEGDVYGWLNADDTLAPGALGKVGRIFEGRPEADAVCGQSLILSGLNSIVGLHPSVRLPDDDLYRTNTISQPSCFVRRDALFQIGLVEDQMHYVMDWDLWVRLYASGRTFAYTPDVLSSVLWADDTKTARLSRQRIMEIRRVVSRLNSPYTTAKTLIGHTLNKIEEYSPFSAPYKQIKGFFESGTVKKSTFWGADARGRNQAAFDIFHYRDCPTSQVRFRFLRSTDRCLSLGRQSPVVIEGDNIEIPLNLPAGEICPVQITSMDDGPLDLDTIELTVSPSPETPIEVDCSQP
jgi:hypothetical protein